MRSILLATLCAFLCSEILAAPAPSHPGPSARDLVEFTHVVQPRATSDDGLHDQVSPDGKRAFIVTRKADVATDKNLYEIQLLDLAPDQLEKQRAPRPEVVFSMRAARDNFIVFQALRNVEWHGDRTLVFLARLDDVAFQLYSLDLPTRKLVQLTHEKNLIVSYAMSQDLRRIVFAAQVPNPPLRDGEHAAVVANHSHFSMRFGQHDLTVQEPKFRYFVADLASRHSARPLGEEFDWAGQMPSANISPDGRWALLPHWDMERVPLWAQRYPRIAEITKESAWSQKADPLRYYTSPRDWAPRLMTAWRLDDGKAQSVVDAPDDRQTSGSRPDRLWQGGGSSVVLLGTFLPPGPDGTTSTASHIVEYWPDRGQWTDIATLEDHFEDGHALADGFLVVDGGKRREFHRKADGGWRESNAAEVPAKGSAWSLRFAQGLNLPPDVYAAGPSGQSRRLTALNPQFKAESWGTMQPYAWHDAAGHDWNGGLLSGSDMDPHARYPLLIQTYGFSPDRFYLDGPNTNDDYLSAFAGRAFLREGILVLAMPYRPKNDGEPMERQSLLNFTEGVRGAVDTLVKEGRVDPDRVGVIGFSSTGKRVLNLATFGQVPIRAATMADGDSNSLFALTLTYGRSDGIWRDMQDSNQGFPFGDTLSGWVRNDPALHTDCVRAAMRIESYGPTVLPNWDEYALLRRQYKPAEMLLFPGGSHVLLVPGDRWTSLQGNVDWYSFWLAGKTRDLPLLPNETAKSVAAQAARWRQMETLKVAADAQPPCAR